LVDKLSVELDAAKARPFLVAVSLRDSNGKLISDQWNWFNFNVETEAVRWLKDMPTGVWAGDVSAETWDAYAQLPRAGLLTLPRTALNAVLSIEGGNGTITIENKGAIPAFNVIIDDFPYEYGNYLDDNSFCLYPDETREIKFQIKNNLKRLNDIAIRAWNADPIKPQFPQSVIESMRHQALLQEENSLRVPDRCVVLTFDDGTVSQFKAASLLKEYGFTATFFISNHDFNFENDPKLQWNQIKQLHEDGFEIASHTTTHPDVRKLCRDEFISELKGIEEKCEQWFIPRPVTFAYPGYHECQKAAEMLREKGYWFARGGGGRPYNPMQDDPMAVPTGGSWGVPTKGQFPPPGDMMEYFIESVTHAQDGKIVILTFHGIPQMDNPRQSLFAAHLEYLKNNGYTVLSFRQLNDVFQKNK
jgi:peptidoglycan/xylan/chitin deacetylase (PgdA/CDA1 family)